MRVLVTGWLAGLLLGAGVTGGILTYHSSPSLFERASKACEANRAYVPSLQGQCLEDYVGSR